MRRVLLVAEGTLDNPVKNVIAIFAGMTFVLLLGFLIIDSNLPIPLMIAAIAVVLILVAWLKARFGGQREFRVEKPAEGGPLRISGRFEDGQVGSGSPRRLTATELSDNALQFTLDDGTEVETYHLRPPAFSGDALRQLHDAIEELRTLTPDEILRRYSSGDRAIRSYDAKQLVLLRYAQKPSYIMVIWMVAGLTVLIWLILAPLLPRVG